MRLKIQYTLSATLLFLLISGCLPESTNGVISRVLVSSKGEKIYINSINWGVTGDYQLSSITKKPIKNIDTLDAIRGLEPFIYSFNHDTLKLFFKHEVRYQIKENFKTIVVIYEPLAFSDLWDRARDNDGYFCVPIQRKVVYPNDMPLPPERK